LNDLSKIVAGQGIWTVLLALGLAAGVSFSSTPLVKALSVKVGAVDVPKDSRRMHNHPIPRMGGLAIFFGFVVAMLLFVPLDRPKQGMLLGAVIIVVLGMLDDKYALPAKPKFLVQIVAALVAVLSVVGLAFSLALQNFLSNVAGGMQLLASHPFAVGDFVDAGGCSGTVAEIGMFYTKLTTPDNKLVQLPNSTIVSANITNFSAQPTRRVELTVSASYDAPTEQVLALLSRMAADHPLVLDDPAPVVHVDSYGDSAIGYVLRAWCANTDYWTVYYDLMDGFKPAFDNAGIEMTYPHVNVHMVER